MLLFANQHSLLLHKGLSSMLLYYFLGFSQETLAKHVKKKTTNTKKDKMLRRVLLDKAFIRDCIL